MITIPVRVCGDTWINPKEVEDALFSSDPASKISLDFQAEGPSIQALKILNLLDRYCVESKRLPDSIFIVNNPNNIEKTQYENVTPGHSHFFKMSKNYWSDFRPAKKNCKKFGYFVGRRTVSRVKILYDLWHERNDQCLFSVMNSHSIPAWTQSQGIVLEKIADWMTPEQNISFCDWFTNCTVTSLDGHFVRDQYIENPITNQDLLNFYDQFAVEIVAETYTLGDTFFPTEKTVRPIMAGKPMIVYGPKNFLTRLRSLGFETYNSCWDESYDQLEGPQRWEAIKKILDQVQTDQHTTQIAQHNRENLKKFYEQ
jgi:hypothetical protein